MVFAIYNKSLSTTSQLMFMSDFWEAPKNEDWLPREATQQLEDGTQPPCSISEEGRRLEVELISGHDLIHHAYLMKPP